MAAIAASNKIAGIAKGQTLTVNSQQGVLAGAMDAFGYPPSVTAVSTGTTSIGVSGGLATVHGACGTPVMHADGSGWAGVPRSFNGSVRLTGKHPKNL